MDTLKGDAKKYLDVDVGTRTWSVVVPDERDAADYIGGKGLGVKMYWDRLGGRLADVDPLGAENLLLFMTGPFLGSGGACSGRFEAVSKSPLTGIMASSSCGGPFGMALRTAGWDGVILRGAAASPVVVEVDKDGATVRDAGDAWGRETGSAREALALGPKDGEVAIGPAGENLVRYANIRSGNRFLGRGGLGAVMGAKKVKAIVARGGAFKVEAADPEAFRAASGLAKKYIVRNSFSKAYKAYGTNYGVNPGVDSGYAPVRNFRDRTDERCRNLSGQAMAERYRTKNSTCVPCSVLCGHKGTYPDGKERHIPEYETIGLWGGNIENWDPDLVGAWNDRMNELGMDTISAGATFSWAMEAAEKGLRPSALAFGKTEGIADMLDDVAHRRGEGDELAEGSRRLAERYGGLEFAAQVKGMEMAAYDPRGAWGQGLNYAVANRGGCHLNAYPVALEVLFGFIPPYSTLSKAAWVAFLEDLFDAVNCTHTCQFTVFGLLLEPFVAKYTPKPLLKLAMTLLPGVAQALLDLSVLPRQLSALTGRRYTTASFLLAGRRTHVLERLMNTRMGISRKDDTLPGRFLHEAETKHPRRSVVPLEPMLRSYYRIKGYGADGVPTEATLRRLGIAAPGARP